MTQTLLAHFDGKVIVPDEPVEFPVGQQLRVRLEIADVDSPRFASLLQFESELPDAPTDLAANHDHYLYGNPQK
jgi:hypothetical protein